MTEEQFLALQEQVNKNTQAIEELKEAFQTLSTAAPATAANESLLQALQEQVAALTTAQQNCRTQCDQLKAQVGSLTDNDANQDKAILLLKQKIDQTDADIDALQQMPSGPQMELVGTTLNITLPTTEETAAAEEPTEST